MEKLIWNQIPEVTSRSYRCGHCGKEVASQRGWSAHFPSAGKEVSFVYVCHYCTKPTFFDWLDNQVPGVAFGEPVSGVTDELVEKLYEEARKAMSAGCYTAAILCCRKLLMHLAVAEGAEPGEKFIIYAEYLTKKHVPSGANWVDHIREKSNEANHEIIMMSRNDAEQLIIFIGMLMKIIYEFQAAMEKMKNPQAS